ncbi:cytochrome P450 [Actinomadura macra]|uniref:cytochrome P450 n=1 Tax=Actinomadura macra TaxID=46164 RepID=UPI00082EA137|nr:cytochrome P450 [Actinomadura macra]
MTHQHQVHQEQSVHGLPQWTVTGYACAERFLNEPRLSNDMTRWAAPERLAVSWTEERLRPRLCRQMMFSDPPDHTRLRRLALPYLTSRRVENRRHGIQQTADRLLRQIGSRSAGTAELLEDFAFPLAITTLCQVAGFPDGYRQAYQRKRLFTAGITILPEDSPQRAVNAANHQRMLQQFHEVIAEKRRHPGPDLVTTLVQSEGRPGGLDHDELTSAFAQLIIAGVEPLARFIAHAVIVLLDHPDQLAELRDDPALMPAAVEELLRFISPNPQGSPRFATQPVTLCEAALAPRDRVTIMLRDANRDPERFRSPERLDLRRDEGPSLAFGKGIHYCPGATLARLEATIALMSLLQQLPNLALTVPRHHIDLQDHLPIFGGPVAVPVHWKPTAN